MHRTSTRQLPEPGRGRLPHLPWLSTHGGISAPLAEMEQRLDDLVGPDTRVIVFADLHGLIDVRRLQRWARWHRRRVALGVLATLGAASALADRKA